MTGALELSGDIEISPGPVVQGKHRTYAHLGDCPNFFEDATPTRPTLLGALGPSGVSKSSGGEALSVPRAIYYDFVMGDPCFDF